MPLTILCFALLGAIIGSFLNVLILRRGVKSLGGRSACGSCGHELEAIDLVPIVSWIFLGGRCRFCKSRISIQYPLVEAATAICFGCIGAAPAPLVEQAAALPVAALLIAISVYDLRHTIIPDQWAYALALFALLFSLVYLTEAESLGSFALYFLAGPVSALPFWALWYVSGGAWMGFGDSKLAWGIGWLLGPLYAYAAIVLAFVLGALVSVLVLLPLSSPSVRRALQGITPTPISKRLAWGFTMKSEVAFGPFLAAACAIVWLMLMFGQDPLAYLAVGL